jgi:hypothetical protein
MNNSNQEVKQTFGNNISIKFNHPDSYNAFDFQEFVEDQLLRQEEARTRNEINRIRLNSEWCFFTPCEDIEILMHEKHLEKLKAEFELRQFKRLLKNLISQIPNDMELGAAVRDYVNKQQDV